MHVHVYVHMHMQVQVHVHVQVHVVHTGARTSLHLLVPSQRRPLVPSRLPPFSIARVLGRQLAKGHGYDTAVHVLPTGSKYARWLARQRVPQLPVRRRPRKPRNRTYRGQCHHVLARTPSLRCFQSPDLQAHATSEARPAREGSCVSALTVHCVQRVV